MKYAAIAIAIVAFFVGLRAAHLWHKASEVQIIPMWERDGRIEPVDINQAQGEWIIAMLQTAQKSGDLNQRGARWTAWAVTLSTLSAIVGSLA